MPVPAGCRAGAGRSTTSKFVSLALKSFPTNHVFSGAADFAITGQQ
jgi:hypothetical protein